MALSLGWTEGDDLSYEFNPLFQQTAEQKAQVQLANANRDQIYVNNGVISEVTVAKQLKEDDVYTNISDEWLKYLQEVEDDDRLNEPDPVVPGVPAVGAIGQPSPETGEEEGEEEGTEPGEGGQTSPDQGAEDG